MVPSGPVPQETGWQSPWSIGKLFPIAPHCARRWQFTISSSLTKKSEIETPLATKEKYTYMCIICWWIIFLSVPYTNLNQRQ